MLPDPYLTPDRSHSFVCHSNRCSHLDLYGMVVTGDGLYTQRPLRVRVVVAGGDYL
jgi:hypothetical protein